ncbi:MAG TPA: phosphoglycolate phosphatase [Gammaproteobacteria bacterium]|jgi:phosphoglycolate phosphatase|nr:phosphoglycolate phosphatase [Gammaproteobacteria bacterium]
MTPIKLVAFDLDGTLVDSASDIARAVDRALLELGQRTHGVEEVKGWVGEGLSKLLKRALTGELDGEPDPALLARCREEFHRFYKEALCVDTRFYPGALEALDALRSRCKLACITNKATEFTLPLLKILGVSGRFDVVVCADTLKVLKPDPAPLFYAAAQVGVVPAACCMVGDSRNDILAAKAAGFYAVAVSYGYRQGTDLLALGADLEVDSLLELPDRLPGLAAGGPSG